MGSSDSREQPTVAVVALQGAVEAHCAALRAVGARPVPIRQVAHLRSLVALDAIVVPGGESTTLSVLLETTGLGSELGKHIASGIPTLGTCAGMILLAADVYDGRDDQIRYAAIDIAVRRNGFGRQVQSCETLVDIDGLTAPFPAVFIRAPRVERVGPGVEVLARLDDGTPVLCRQGSVWVSAFHPELTDDRRVHEMFLDSLRESPANIDSLRESPANTDSLRESRANTDSLRESPANIDSLRESPANTDSAEEATVLPLPVLDSAVRS